MDRTIDELRQAGVTITDSDAVARDRVISPGDGDSLLAQTPHLQLLRRNGWDFVRRTTASGVVAIIAVTPHDELLLIEQYRPPVGQRVIEWPAGLVADTLAAQGESLEQAAVRELLEETGYRAGSVRSMVTGASSAGLTDELTDFVLATQLERVSPGGGDESEEITLHHVPRARVDSWLRQQTQAGRLIDARVPSGLYLLERKW